MKPDSTPEAKGLYFARFYWPGLVLLSAVAGLLAALAVPLHVQ